MRTLVIPRKRWLCGKLGSGASSKLYRIKDKRMCCFGMYARQLCRAKVKDIEQLSSPRHSPEVKWPAWMLSEKYDGYVSNSVPCTDIMGINDSVSLTARQREMQVKEQFAKHDVKVIFTGTYT